MGVLFGLFAALVRCSKVKPGALVGKKVYIWYFRGTPLLVQWPCLLGLGSPTSHFPALKFGLNFYLPGTIQAGTLALGINEGSLHG